MACCHSSESSPRELSDEWQQAISIDFAMSYQAQDCDGRELYLSMLSDWDMDAAFQCASDPYLKLKVDLKPFEEGLDDWDIIAPADIPSHRISSFIDKNSLLGSITGTITGGVSKTMSHMQKAMGLKHDDNQFRPSKPPMSDQEFRNYLDSVGHLVKPHEFRLSIYQGGVEPSLRRVVWRHLLNIYPSDLSGKERFDYLKQKEKDYYKLRDQWKEHINSGNASEEVKYVIQMVKKDVLRTDRNHKFYSGADDNKNVISLFHLLVTYALTHPQDSYCQGMSDIASPLLVTQKDEASAYICFCGAMKRLSTNFGLDGNSVNIKFQHLSDLLHHADPEYFKYLEKHHANDLFFCYRWLLLELKREFPFEDALYMLEVMWSTLPPDPPEAGILLTDPSYSPAILSNLCPSSPTFANKHMIYSKLLAMRRIGHLRSYSKEKIQSGAFNNNNVEQSTYDDSPADDDKPVFPCMDDPMLETMRCKSASISESLKDSALHADVAQIANTSLSEKPIQEEVIKLLVEESDKVDDGIVLNDGDESQSQFHLSLEASVDSGHDSDTKHNDKPESYIPPIKGSFFSGMKKVIQNSQQTMPVANSRNSQQSTPQCSDANKQENSTRTSSRSPVRKVSECAEITEHSELKNSTSCYEPEKPLPPPEEFGCGNPFLMFICLSLLLQHRDRVIFNQMEYDELAMFFDKLVRRHNVNKVLHYARLRYTEYLKSCAAKLATSQDSFEKYSV